MTSSPHSSHDRIRLTGLSARGYHGVLPSEREEGQLFSVDLVLDLGARGTAVAAQTDSIDDAVDYSVLAAQVVEVIEGEPVNLIETLAERVADVALVHPRVRSVRVTVHKPQAPLAVAFDDVAVSVMRTCDEPWPGVDEGAVAAEPPVPGALPAPAPGDEDEARAAGPESAQAPVPVEEASGEGGDQEDAETAGAVIATTVGGAGAGLAAAGIAFAAARAADGADGADEYDESQEALGAAADGPSLAPDAEPEPAPEPEQTEEPEPAPEPVNPLDSRPQGRPAEVVIALGGNVGGVVPALRQAVATLRETEGVEVTAVAPLARTQAVTEAGAELQPDYLNTVVLARTSLSPREVLDLCHALEDAAGRIRTQHWGPRTLDADLVDYEGVTSQDPELTLPHPRAAERAFVLVPWSQADPFAELGGQVVATLAEQAPDREGVRWLALDWIDSDRLPALPTGQYVAPPAPVEGGPAGAAGAAGDAPAPAPGDEEQRS